MRQFAPPAAPNASLQRLQDAIAASLRDIQQCDLLDGRLIEDIDLTAATPRAIAHGLGRNFRGWMLVRQSAAADIYEGAASSPDLFLSLTASANVTVSLWVF